MVFLQGIFVANLSKNQLPRQDSNRDTNIENEHVDIGGEGEGEMNWEITTNTNTPSCVKQTASRKGLYTTGSLAHVL